MKIRSILLGAAVCLSYALTTQADEGMWMLHEIDPLTEEAMKNLGLELTPRELYSTEEASLKDAVVDFGDFCSGVVVSPEGLVFTNHHCGYGAIQSLSTPERDLLKDGFVARKRKEELPVDGLFVKFLQRTENCTSRVMMALDSLYKAHPGESAVDIDHQYADSICRAVEDEYTKDNPGMECLVKKYFGGNAYYVSLYKVYRDIRLVFTATETMGKFGGDTDNWMWPRQTCDFSVFRIYAGKDNEPAEYSPKNKPYKPRRYARVSLQGYQPGDFCMTIGYPGSTSRYLSSWGIDERMNARNVSTIQVRGLKQEVWKDFMDKDCTVAIQYAAKWASSSNYWKNSIGMNKALTDLGVIRQKQELEQQVKAWYEKDEELQRRFGHLFPSLEQAYGSRRNAVYAQGFFSETFMRGIEIYRVARMLNSMPQDADQQEQQRVREQMSSFFKNYNASLDEKTMGALLQNYRQQVTDREMWPSLYDEVDSLFAGDCEAYARHLFSQTICLDTTAVDRLMADSTLRESDPALRYAASIPDKYQEIGGRQREENKRIQYNERLLTQALLEMEQETPHYSDANFSMRLSYGFVQDYSANGNHYPHYTNAQSLLEKAARQDQIEDYSLEEDIVALLQKGGWGRYADRQDKDLHLCFLSNNDITGGNSGSPMFDAKGRLIGLAFDGNWEAMSGDISFNSELQRCIGVDIRFVLYMMDKWGKASHLIREIRPE